jgi:hypothetical protein
MGMGYGACFEWVVSEGDVKGFCEEEFDIVDKLLNKYEVAWEDLAIAIRYDDVINELEDNQSDEIYFAFKQLVKKFKEKTDLTMDLGYHNRDDDGDRYDEVDGYFFVVNFSEIYQLTPVGQKAKEKGIDIGVKTYVSYG